MCIGTTFENMVNLHVLIIDLCYAKLHMNCPLHTVSLQQCSKALFSHTCKHAANCIPNLKVIRCPIFTITTQAQATETACATAHNAMDWPLVHVLEDKNSKVRDRAPISAPHIENEKIKYSCRKLGQWDTPPSSKIEYLVVLGTKG